MVSAIPYLWSYLKRPIKAIHDYFDPIPEDEEYDLVRNSRTKLYNNMYSHLKNEQYSPADSYNAIKKHIPKPNVLMTVADSQYIERSHHDFLDHPDQSDRDFLDHNLVH